MRALSLVLLLAPLLALGSPHALAQPAVAAPRTGQVFISNERSSQIFVLDHDDAVIGSFSSCARPRGLHFTQDHQQLIVACGGDNTIAFYDVATRKLMRRFRDVPDPETFDLAPNGRDLYVSNEDSAEATVINIQTGEVTGHFPTGEEPEGVLVTPDGRYAFVASEAGNLVHVIDIAAQKVIRDIFVSERPRRFALTPDGKSLWVSCEIAGVVDVIDVATLTRTKSLTFAPRGMTHDEVTPVDIAMNRAGTRAWVALGRANNVAVVDIASMEVIDYILVGRRPWGLRLSADEKKLYVANGLSDDVAIIDVARGKVTKAIPVGVIPYAIAIDE